MARTLTPEQAATLRLSDYQVVGRLRVESRAGEMVDLTDWLILARGSDDIDATCERATFELAREEYPIQSLSPLMDASPLNAEGPALNLVRMVIFDAAVAPHGRGVTEADFIERFRGRIDSIEFGGDRIVLSCRDEGGQLEDWILEQPVDHPAGLNMDQMLQAILDAAGTGITLVSTSSASNPVLRKGETTARGAVMPALSDIAAGVGDMVRYRRDSQGIPRLTRFTPERENPAVDHTFGPSEYSLIRQLDVDISDVRTKVTVEFPARSADGETFTRESVTVIAPQPVIDEFGAYRTIIVTESDDSRIDSLAEAREFAEAILSDLSQPWATHQIETFWAPHVELTDYCRFLPNGVHYDTAQSGGVVARTWEYGRGRLRDTITTRGTPSGGYLRWLMMGNRPGEFLPPPPVPEPFGALTAFIEPDGRLLFHAHGNDDSLSLRWAATLLDAPPEAPTETIDAREAVGVMTGLVVPPGGRGTVAVWWHSAAAGGGTMGRRVTSVVERPAVPEVANNVPYIDRWQTEHEDATHVAVRFWVNQREGARAGGTLEVWTNPTSVDSPNPEGPPTGSVVTQFVPPFYAALGGALTGVLYHPGRTKTVFARYTNVDGISTGIVEYTLESHLPIIDPDGSLANFVVNTDNIVNEAITNAKLGQLAVGTGNLQAESVTGDIIAARTIGVQNLIVASWENLVANPGFELGTGIGTTIRTPWVVVGASGGQWTTQVDNGPRSGRVCMIYNQQGQTEQARLSSSVGKDAIQCAVGDKFYGEVWARRRGTGNWLSTAGVRITFRDSEGALLSQAYGVGDVLSETYYSQFSVTATAPSGAAMVMLECVVNYLAGSTGMYGFDDAYLRRMVEGSLIVDGTIQARHIEAASITADKLAVNTLAAISADLGIVSAGRIQNHVTAASSTAGIAVSEGYGLPSAWNTYIDLRAAGTNFIKTPQLEVRKSGQIIINNSAGFALQLNRVGSGGNSLDFAVSGALRGWIAVGGDDNLLIASQVGGIILQPEDGLFWTVSGVRRRIGYGAVDSGGAGYRMLRVSNNAS